MKPENLTELSSEQLLKKIKELKTNKIIDATLIGITVGVAIYGAIKNGFEFFTFFPLIIGYLIVRNSKNNEILGKEIRKELDSRK